MNATTQTGCQHPADNATRTDILMQCPDCRARCSAESIGDDGLCYDAACPLHVLAGPAIVTEYDVAMMFRANDRWQRNHDRE